MLTNLITKKLSTAAPTGLKRVQLKQLPYELGDLEPVMSGQILDLHYSRHHRGYVNNLNNLLEQQAEALATSDIRKLVSLQKPLHFNGGGHINHTLFWDNLCAPADSQIPTEGPFHDAVVASWGSFDAFFKVFNTHTATLQGSGWGWLCYNKRLDALSYRALPNQDIIQDVSPFLVPIIGIDVWEHAYYLDYKNARPQFLNNIWKIVNWREAERRFIAAREESMAENAAASKL